MSFSASEQQRLLAYYTPRVAKRVVAVIGPALSRVPDHMVPENQRAALAQLRTLLSDPAAAESYMSNLIKPQLLDLFGKGGLPSWSSVQEVAHLMDSATEAPGLGGPANEEQVMSVLRATWPAFIRHYCEEQAGI